MPARIRTRTPITLWRPHVDSATTAWVNAVVSAGGTVSATSKGFVDTLIIGLKADSLWATIDAMWLFANWDGDAHQATIDITAATGANLAASVVGSPTLTTKQGYAAGVADTDYLNTNYTPSSSKVHLAQDSASIGSYVRTAQTTRHSLLGGGDASQGLSAENFRNSSQVTEGINDGASAINAGGTIGAVGFHLFTRTASNNVDYYFNGSSAGSNADISIGLPTKPLYVLTNNQNGSPGNGGTEQVSIVVIAGAWDATKNANFYTRVQNYMTSLGTQV